MKKWIIAIICGIIGTTVGCVFKYMEWGSEIGVAAGIASGLTRALVTKD